MFPLSSTYTTSPRQLDGEGNREGETDFPVFGKGILFYPIFEAPDSFAENEGP